jgi:hypothetical protein
LTDACAEAGLEVGEVLDRLADEAPVDAPEDWAALDPGSSTTWRAPITSIWARAFLA